MTRQAFRRQCVYERWVIACRQSILLSICFDNVKTSTRAYYTTIISLSDCSSKSCVLRPCHAVHCRFTTAWAVTEKSFWWHVYATQKCHSSSSFVYVWWLHPFCAILSPHFYHCLWILLQIKFKSWWRRKTLLSIQKLKHRISAATYPSSIKRICSKQSGADFFMKQR